MFVELHMLQNFAPSCLNRDDTNSPKECTFGGHRRARISSQCLKRAIRADFKKNLLLPAEHLSQRTKRLVEEVSRRLSAKGRDKAQAPAVVEAALRGAGFGLKEKRRTEYLLFLGEREIHGVAELCEKHWDTLAGATSVPAASEQDSAKKRKRAGKGAIPAEIGKAVLALLDGGKAADLALFGRMLADLPTKNVDAACQVAHALSANKVGVEFDFYTAVDDLKDPKDPEEEEGAGAGMMGTVEFNSACFYRYANIDLEQLKRNLDDDEELAKRTVEAFLRAAVTAIPTGKQNSMAAQNPPSFIFAVVRDRGLWSLANAFVDPVRADGKGDLVLKSIAALEGYWQKLAKVYGEQGVWAKCAVALEEKHIKALPDGKTFENLVKTVTDNIRFEPRQEEPK